MSKGLDRTCERVAEILRNCEDADVGACYRGFRTAEEFHALKATLDRLAMALPCSLRRARIFKVLSDMMRDDAFAGLAAGTPTALAAPATLAGPAPIAPADPRAMMRLWGEAYEELAFANVRLAIEACVPEPEQLGESPLAPGLSVRVDVPARIDLGGGWSDTPPYSLEKGGAVVNIAVALDGRCPVVTWAKTITEPTIRLQSLDLGIAQEISKIEELQTYDDVEDPLALLKAAVVFEGIVPRGGAGPVKAHAQALGAGLELITECRLPKGSGMGMSSIVAAAAVAALAALRGRQLRIKDLFDHVLCVEQMMTTGGGWQDQIGGAVGGIKYTHTTATAPLQPTIETLALPDEVMREFNDRLVVFYTGRNRLAKNILRRIMADYLSRREPVFGTLSEIRRTADRLREAFGAGDLETVGALMSRSWELNKTVNPTTSNEHIDALFMAVQPYISGGKLAGAGGGGFMALLARDRPAAAQVRKMLHGLSIGTEQRLHEAAVDPVGLRIKVE